jgi:hypothetical protein
VVVGKFLQYGQLLRNIEIKSRQVPVFPQRFFEATRVKQRFVIMVENRENPDFKKYFFADKLGVGPETHDVFSHISKPEGGNKGKRAKQ